MDESCLTQEREEKFKDVVANRQADITVILENVHDPHNISAVLRSCDAVGIKEIYILYTDPNMTEDRIKLGKNAASGANRWVDVHFYHDLKACMDVVKPKYKNILHTKLDEKSTSLYELNLTQSTAFVFGNEHAGVTEDLVDYCTGSFVIPMVGMVESLNISVACAVSVYEMLRQRQNGNSNLLSVQEQEKLFEEYHRRHVYGESRRKVRKIQ